MPDFLHSLLNSTFNSGNQFLQGGLAMMVLGATVAYLRSLPSYLYSVFLRNYTIVFDVHSSDPAHEWLTYWLSKSTYGKKSRRVSLKHVRSGGGSEASFVPSKGSHWFFHKKKPIWMTRTLDSDGKQSSTDQTKETISLRIIGRNRSILESFVKEVEDIYTATMDTSLVSIYVYEGNGWMQRKRKRRNIESMFLPSAASDLLKDVQTFLDRKDWYDDKGVPYRRGYLFSGPPGTGKSSIAYSLACHFNLTLHILDIGQVSDTQFSRAMANAGGTKDRPSIILLEDIDTAGVGNKRKVESKGEAVNSISNGPPESPVPASFMGIGLGTLLNTLDGVTSSDNYILIMTSNHHEKLDPALVRSGRVDKKVEFGLAEREQIKAATKYFLPNPTKDQLFTISTWKQPISMTDVQENLKNMVLGEEKVEVVEEVRELVV